jgi:hypothetical protein
MHADGQKDVPAPSPDSDFRTTTAQALLHETRATGIALAGLAFGSGIGLLAAALLCASGIELAQWGSVGSTCLAIGMFAGFTLVVGFGIRLKTALDRLNSLEASLMASLGNFEFVPAVPPSFGRAVKHARCVRYPTTLREGAQKETAALLERFMLPRKDKS